MNYVFNDVNMKTLFMPIAISGSGKSTYFKNKFLNDFPYVKNYLQDNNINVFDIISCPDEIRKEILGDINDQSNGFLIWKTAKERLFEILSKYDYAIIDATNTNGKSRKQFLKNFKNYNLIGLVFKPDIDICNERIQNDLNQKIDRSAVPYNVLQRQLSQFKHSVIKDDKWDGLWNNNIKKNIIENLIEFNEIKFI